MAFLHLEGLVKRFGDFVAVERMDLDVERGEFVSLLGPSGCGKTTTLQMIAGFVTPTEGRVFINGKDITDVKPNHRDLGIVFQSYALFPHMSVADNVSFGLEMRNVEKKERNERVRETLSLVHLSEFAHRYPNELSGGQRQRVALARALVIKPEVLLLDEPLSALDAKIREDMQIELRAIQRTVGTTTILVTHDQAEAMAMSDRIAVMNKGKLVQVDQPFAAYEFPGDSFVSSFLGKSNMFEGTVSALEDGRAVVAALGVLLVTTARNLEQGTRVQASIRPEKIRLVGAADGIVKGTVHARIFQGNHWIFQIATAHGTFIVVVQNSGEQKTAEADEVGLTWSEEEVRVLPMETQDAS